MTTKEDVLSGNFTDETFQDKKLCYKVSREIGELLKEHVLSPTETENLGKWMNGLNYITCIELWQNLNYKMENLFGIHPFVEAKLVFPVINSDKKVFETEEERIDCEQVKALAKFTQDWYHPPIQNLTYRTEEKEAFLEQKRKKEEAAYQEMLKEFGLI